MFAVWAQFEISTGRITDAGSTVFSGGNGYGETLAQFADYASELGYTEFARHDGHINREWDAGIVMLAAFNGSAEADAYAHCVRSAAVAVFTLRTVQLGCRDLPLGEGCRGHAEYAEAEGQ